MQKGIIKNCWEHMKCGREPGGENVDEFGICPAAVAEKYDGVNRGKNGGRFCWYVAGTLCPSGLKGVFAEKFQNCLECPFYLEVEKQEGSRFILTEKDIGKKL